MAHGHITYLVCIAALPMPAHAGVDPPVYISTYRLHTHSCIFSALFPGTRQLCSISPVSSIFITSPFFGYMGSDQSRSFCGQWFSLTPDGKTPGSAVP